MSQCLNAIQGRHFAAAGGPELIAIEVGGQSLFLHGLDQFSELGAGLQPFGDTQN
mgnify:CR=1 FL=1